MIPNVQRELTSGGIDQSATFGLSIEDSAHIMTILRDTLYSDKVLAVLREYSSNAWDEHRMAGKGDVPIKVTLPTPMDPKLSIRDYGPGLSRDGVFKVYTQYGKSTKRHTDNAVGMLGIGSKSAFAYADSFTVTSWHGGKKSMYAAVLDKSDKGTMNLLHEEDCDPSETGIEIQVAVNQKDIGEFNDKARDLFKHFIPRPEINIDLPELPSKSYNLKSGFLYVNREIGWNDQGWTAVMGCVPYKVNLDQVRDVKPGIGENAYGLSGVLYFDIGEVQINASREELKYSDSTKQAIVDKVNSLVDEFVQHVLADVEAKGKTPWDKITACGVLRRLNLPALNSKKLMKGRFLLPSGEDKDGNNIAPKTFDMSGPDNTKHVFSVEANSDSCLYIHDSPRALKGYRLGSCARIIRRKSRDVEYKDMEKELRAVVKKMGIEGIPIKKLSDMEWHKSSSTGIRSSYYNKKHTRKLFCLIDNPRFGTTKSDDWTDTEHETSASDVFVVLNRFNAYDDFSKHALADKTLCEFFDIPFPKVLGYKSTDKKPLDETKVLGQEYREWRKGLYKLLDSPESRDLVNLYYWAEDTSCSYSGVYNNRKKRFESLPETLGKDNPIVVYMAKKKYMTDKYKKFDYKKKQVIRYLSPMFKKEESESTLLYKELKTLYPMLFKVTHGRDGFYQLWADANDSAICIEYVQMMDRLHSQNANKK